MRVSLFVIGLLVLRASAAGTPAADLRGTARAGDRPQPNASFRDGKKLDLGLYPVGVQKPVVFDKPGLSRIFCNIHPNMAAYVLAVDSPYFGVTDDRGAFAIPLVPSGRFTFHAWRPGGTNLTGTLIADGSPLDVRWP